MARSTSIYIMLLLIIGIGLPMDATFTYDLWNRYSSPEKILESQKAMLKTAGLDSLGLDSAEMETELTANPEVIQKLASMSKIIGLMLLVFFIWDLVAYLSLLRFKNWARVYVLTIAVLYVICIFIGGSLLQFCYGVFATFFLLYYKKLFKGKGKDGFDTVSKSLL
jgi:hypothetical protein